MTTTFPTEEMTIERGAALVRMAKLQRIEEARLRKNVDAPIWKDWVFWLGILLAGNVHINDVPTQSSPLGWILIVVALDRVVRKRARAARELNERQLK
jgi:predicted protein tyrosine phosphatase